MAVAKAELIFFSYQTRRHTIGVEYNERIYEKAVENREQGLRQGGQNLYLQMPCSFRFRQR